MDITTCADGTHKNSVFINKALVASITVCNLTNLGSTYNPVTPTSTPLPITEGGTNATNAVTALKNLLPSLYGNSGKVLGNNGSAISWVAGGNGSGNFVTTSTDYEMSSDDQFVYVTSAANVTLPPPTSGKQVVIITKILGESNVNIYPNADELINDSSGFYSYFSYGAFLTIQFVSDGTDWFITAKQ